MVLKQIKQKLFGAKPAPAELRDYFASEKFQPVFFLSTGRCGTLWFTELLQQNPKLSVHHNTPPELYEQSLLAWQLHYSGRTTADTDLLLSEMVFCARQDLMSKTIQEGKRFVETNNRITFFTPQLARIFPHAKFVHLYRDPAGFVRSGMNRNWYLDSRFDHARPAQWPDNPEWEKMNRVARIAWLWRETNQYIDEQLAKLPDHRYQRFNFSALNTAKAKALFDWLEIDIATKTIEGQLNKKVNAQRTGSFPSFDDWSGEDRAAFITECGAYAESLGFDYKPYL